MSPEFYQAIADRSWRRSGALLYRPDPRKSCCPHYTVRLDSLAYKPNRNQRQALNKFNKYILGPNYIKEAARLYPRTREQARLRDTEFEFPARVHEAEYRNVKTPPEPAHKFTVTLEDDSFSEEKYVIYEKYQQLVHGEKPGDVSRRGFEKFLCNSPLRRGKFEGDDGTERDVGSFHQCYRIDGKLVAVGILDLLPHCVSSVYFMYDESIYHFSPGKLSAMMEISLAIERGYRWWYAGFYIHSCPKMKYKMDFSPQYILDAETYAYIPVDEGILKILEGPYQNLTKAHARWLQDKATLSADALNKLVKDDETKNSNKDTGDGDEDSDEEWLNDSLSSVFLFDRNMPGIRSLEEIRDADLDKLPIHIRSSDVMLITGDISYWKDSRKSQYPGLKASIAELVAALGEPDILKNVCLQFVQ
ncbi:hypothetical protein TD95_002211 [Thielaviopsis punctulata]|uniref:arginyltransferase n=1 Tax=Thielaviopsis punctulata TaxID=72032 RepID=A0A0F4ZJ81_9PEZI|nr:hypothetical protein TD95_002211 [Thielaviopsis punctulata]